jgi:hypothetical protein
MLQLEKDGAEIGYLFHITHRTEKNEKKKKERKMITVWPCQITGMAVLWFWREREEREGRKGEDKK